MDINKERKLWIIGIIVILITLIIIIGIRRPDLIEISKIPLKTTFGGT